jgi:hypothetical protein
LRSTISNERLFDQHLGLTVLPVVGERLGQLARPSRPGGGAGVDRDNAGHRGYGLHAGLDVVDGHVVDAVHQACGGRVGPKAMALPGL